MDNYLKKFVDFFNIDWQKKIGEFWTGIDPVYKKSFLYIFLTLCVVFSFHTINFMWGNHDWYMVKHKISTRALFFCGRYSALYLQQLTGMKYLPIINNLLCFAGLSAGALALAIYWKIPKSVFNYTLLGVFITTLPFTMSWFYYIHAALGCTSLAFFAITALILSEKAGQSKNKILLNCIAILLFVYSFGCYIAILSTLLTVFIAKLLLERLTEGKSLKTFLSENKYTILNGIISLGIYKIILIIMKYQKVYNPHSYNSTLVTLSDIPYKAAATIKVAFECLWNNVVFFSSTIKIMLLVFVILVSFIILVCQFLKIKENKNYFMYFIGSAIIFFILILSKDLTFFLAGKSSENVILYTPRIAFFGLAYFYTFFLAFLMLKKLNFFKNLIVIFAITILPTNILNIFNIQKIWKLGYDAEMKNIERMQIRIEDNPNFNINKKYKLIAVGEFPCLRENYYSRKKDKTSFDLLTHTYMKQWTEYNTKASGFDFFYPVSYIQSYIAAFLFDDPQQNEKDKDIMHVSNYLFETAKPYPDKDSIYIQDDYIVIVNSQKGLDDLKDYLRKNHFHK